MNITEKVNKATARVTNKSEQNTTHLLIAKSSIAAISFLNRITKRNISVKQKGRKI